MGNLTCKTGYDNDDMKVLITGINGSGKTACLYRLKHGELVPTEHTVHGEPNVETILHKYHSFNTWDMGGRSGSDYYEYRVYFHMSRCLIHVVDSTDREGLEQSIDQLDTVTKYQDRKTLKTPIVILANKQDLPDAMTPQEVYNKISQAENMRYRTWTVFGTSAKTGEGFEECLDWLVDEMDKLTKLYRFKKLFSSNKSNNSTGKNDTNDVANEKDVGKMTYFTDMVGAFKRMMAKEK